MNTKKELYAYALGYYYGRAEGNNPGLFDGEPEAHFFNQGYDLGVFDYCCGAHPEEMVTDESRSYGPAGAPR
jgi:hypothetical protein